MHLSWGTGFLTSPPKLSRQHKEVRAGLDDLLR
jgi:hypothetical protein